jgi:hypothetical protein
MDQHELMVRVLQEAGGQPVEGVVPAGHEGKIADILFAAENVVVEVKSLTTDRAAEPATAQAVSEMFNRNLHLGAPKILDAMTINVHDLEPKVAINTMRIVAQRVRDEAKAANRQIKATKEVLGRADALGVVAIITPPFKLDRNSIVWAMGDAMREDRCSGIDLLFLAETPLAAPAGVVEGGSSFLSFHPRGGFVMPRSLSEAIYQAWGRVTGQMGRLADVDDFHKYGATS